MTLTGAFCLMHKAVKDSRNPALLVLFLLKLLPKAKTHSLNQAAAIKEAMFFWLWGLEIAFSLLKCPGTQFLISVGSPFCWNPHSTVVHNMLYDMPPSWFSCSLNSLAILAAHLQGNGNS